MSRPAFLDRPGPKYSWDLEPPQGAFWENLDYKIIRSFPLFYTTEELEALVKYVDPAIEPEAKLQFLTQKLEQRFQEKKDLIGPSTHYQNIEPTTWGKLVVFLGTLYCRTGNSAKGIKMIRQATLSAPDGKAHLPWLQNLAVELEKVGELAEAEAYARQTLQLLRKDTAKLGKDSPMTLGTLTLLTKIEARQGKFEQADKHFTELSELVDGMKGGVYEKYEPEIRQNRDDFEKQMRDIKESFSKNAHQA
jgi:tetratricopeptide (TPR) repeat protein